MKKIRFAFAVDNSNIFEKKHFGDADKYMIYEYNSENQKIKLIKEEENVFKKADEIHGSVKKGNAIIQFLKSHNVQVLVSMQFGKNISMVNKYFVPIIVFKEKLKDVIEILANYINWLEEELSTEKTEYKAFRINKGILKYSIN